MPTWLDEWCIGRAHARRQEYNGLQKAYDEACRNDGAAAGALTFVANVKCVEYERCGQDPPSDLFQLSFLAPYFWTPDEVESPVAAFQLGKGMLDEFPNFEPSDNSVQQSRQLILNSLSTYIDIPPGMFPLGDIAEIRAIFLEPWILDLDKPKPNGMEAIKFFRICAVVGRKEDRQYRFTTWTDDYCNLDITNQRPIPNAVVRFEPERPTFDDLIDGAGLTIDQFRNWVEGLVLFTLEKSRNQAWRKEGEIPIMAAGNKRRERGHDVTVRDRFSLFRVQRLAPQAPAHDNRQNQDRQYPKWTLDRRIMVREHWRLQPFGPRDNRQTKYIPIRAHQRGPHNGLPLHPLVKVAQ